MQRADNNNWFFRLLSGVMTPHSSTWDTSGMILKSCLVLWPAMLLQRVALLLQWLRIFLVQSS